MANNRENPFGSYFSFFGAKVIKLLGWAKALGPPTTGNCLVWCSVPFTFGIRYLIRFFYLFEPKNEGETDLK